MFGQGNADLIDYLTVASSAAECSAWVADITKHIPASASPIKFAPVWNPDTSKNECELCRVHFTLLNRKHHCRNCGILVCDACSKRNLLLKHIDKRPVRVCDKCFSNGAVISAPPIEATKLERQGSNGESVLSYADSDDESDEEAPMSPPDTSRTVSDVAPSSPSAQSEDVNKCANCAAKFSLFSSKNQCQYCYRNVCKQCFGNEILHNKAFLKVCNECTYCAKPSDPVQPSGHSSPPSVPPPVPPPPQRAAPLSLASVFQSEETEQDSSATMSSTAKVFAKPAKRSSITVLDTEYDIRVITHIIFR